MFVELDNLGGAGYDTNAATLATFFVNNNCASDFCHIIDVIGDTLTKFHQK